MAKNQIMNVARQLSVACSHPATPKSGDPVRFGTICGVALTDERADGTTTVRFNDAVVDVSVKGVNGSGNSAVAPGDQIFYVDADTPVLSKKATGTLFGTALEAVSSGGTDTIRVKLAEQ